MKQFDIFANPFPRSRERQPFLVALQSDLLAQSLDTVVVAPLETADSRPCGWSGSRWGEWAGNGNAHPLSRLRGRE